VPQTKSELWWSAYCAALSSNADLDSQGCVIKADAAMKQFADRWPEIWKGMAD
jgi:hypothetical protein